MIQDFDPRDWMLTFIPETINGEPLTLSSIDRFVSDCKNDKKEFKSNYLNPLKDFGISDTTVKSFKAHYVMLSKDVLGAKDLEKGTRGKSFKIQEELVKQAGYEIPDLIDTVVSIFMHHLSSGDFIYPESLYDDLSMILTCVKETSEEGWRVIVGAFSDSGLSVHCNGYDADAVGASCARKSLGH